MHVEVEFRSRLQQPARAIGKNVAVFTNDILAEVTQNLVATRLGLNSSTPLLTCSLPSTSTIPCKRIFILVDADDRMMLDKSAVFGRLGLDRFDIAVLGQARRHNDLVPLVRALRGHYMLWSLQDQVRFTDG